MKPDVDVVEGSQVRVLVIFVVSSLRCGGGGLGGGRRIPPRWVGRVR
jgi:hypothetical protein